MSRRNNATEATIDAIAHDVSVATDERLAIEHAEHITSQHDALYALTTGMWNESCNDWAFEVYAKRALQLLGICPDKAARSVIGTCIGQCLRGRFSQRMANFDAWTDAAGDDVFRSIASEVYMLANAYVQHASPLVHVKGTYKGK